MPSSPSKGKLAAEPPESSRLNSQRKVAALAGGSAPALSSRKKLKKRVAKASSSIDSIEEEPEAPADPEEPEVSEDPEKPATPVAAVVHASAHEARSMKASFVAMLDSMLATTGITREATELKNLKREAEDTDTASFDRPLLLKEIVMQALEAHECAYQAALSSQEEVKEPSKVLEAAQLAARRGEAGRAKEFLCRLLDLGVQTGFNWECTGSTKPSKGVHLDNTRLAEALAKKYKDKEALEFTEEEWKAFGVDGLKSNHFVEASDHFDDRTMFSMFYKLAPPAPLHTSCVEHGEDILLGPRADFFRPIGDFLGPPNPNLMQSMEVEHCESADSNLTFNSQMLALGGTLPINQPFVTSTTPHIEWFFVVDPSDRMLKKTTRAVQEKDQAWGRSWPQASLMHNGKKRDGPKREPIAYTEIFDTAQELGKVGKSLTKEEVVAARLYCGPMFSKYNAVLRSIGHIALNNYHQPDEEEEDDDDGNQQEEASWGREGFLMSEHVARLLENGQHDIAGCKGNIYVSTLQVINSVVLKLSTTQEKVYRCLSGATLSRSLQCKVSGGGVEFGFMSCCNRKEDAIAMGDSSSVLVEMSFGPNDRAANIARFSQYRSSYDHAQTTRLSRGEGAPVPRSKQMRVANEVVIPAFSALEVESFSVEDMGGSSRLIISTKVSVNSQGLPIEQTLGRIASSHRQLLDVLTDDLRFRGVPKLALWPLTALKIDAEKRDHHWFSITSNYHEAISMAFDRQVQVMKMLADRTSERGMQSELSVDNFKKLALLAAQQGQHDLAVDLLLVWQERRGDEQLVDSPTKTTQGTTWRQHVVGRRHSPNASTGGRHSTAMPTSSNARRNLAKVLLTEWKLEQPWPATFVALCSAKYQDSDMPIDLGMIKEDVMLEHERDNILNPFRRERKVLVLVKNGVVDAWENARIIRRHDDRTYDVKSWRIRERLPQEWVLAPSSSGIGAVLREAAKQGEEELVEMLLSANASVYECDEDANLPIYLAARAGHANVCKLLYDADERTLQVRNRHRKNTQDTALTHNHVEVVRVLNPTMADEDLHQEDCERFEQILKADNIQHDAVLSGRLWSNNVTTLMLACARGGPPSDESKRELTVVEELVENNPADLQAQSRKGCTALIMAVRAGFIDAVKLLLEREEKAAGSMPIIEVSDDSGRTPLSYAAVMNQVDILRLLLKYGAKVDPRRSKIDRNGDKIASSDGRTPLMETCQNGFIECVNVLLEGNADPAATNNRKETPVMFAARYGHTKIVHLLDVKRVQQGTSFESDKNGFTALHRACAYSHIDIILDLLRSQAANDNNAARLLSIVDGNGNTPLLSAVLAGQDMVTALLLDRGADGAARQNEGKTAVWLAAESGHTQVLKVLLQYTACREAFNKPCFAEQTASGLLWSYEKELPVGGAQIMNVPLSEALAKQTKFTQEEWNEFALEGLTSSTFIKVGEQFARPVADASKTTMAEVTNRASTFMFISARELRKCRDRSMPTCRELLYGPRKSWLKQHTLLLRKAMKGHYTKQYLAVSHRWEQIDKPDPNGLQLTEVRQYLLEHKEIEWVWYDDWCMLQGERSKEEDIDFKAMLQNMNLLYLSCSVLILQDNSYMSRFWTLLEAWIAMRRPSQEGLVAFDDATNGRACSDRRFDIRLLHNAKPRDYGTDNSADGALLDRELIRQSRCTANELMDKLRLTDIQVTNQKDKDSQIPKVAVLDHDVIDNFNETDLTADQQELGPTPLMIACQRGHEGAARVLLDVAKDEGMRPSRDELSSLLLSAIKSGRGPLITLLMSQVLRERSYITPNHWEEINGYFKDSSDSIISQLVDARKLWDKETGKVVRNRQVSLKGLLTRDSSQTRLSAEGAYPPLDHQVGIQLLTLFEKLQHAELPPETPLQIERLNMPRLPEKVEGDDAHYQENHARDDDLRKVLDGTADYKVPRDAVRYKEELGRGRFGVVLKAIAVGSELAAKKVNFTEAERSELTSLKKEFTILKRLTHPNIVALKGVVVDDPKELVVLMEFAPFGSLRAMLNVECEDKEVEIRISGPDNGLVQVSIAEGLAAGMKYLHAQTPPILHGDLKSDNCLVFRVGSEPDSLPLVKLADFGFAELEKTMSQSKSRSSHHGGTFAYFAPEQFDEEFDVKSEVYSFGCMCWELLTGKVPWQGVSQAAVCKKVFISEKRPPLTSEEEGSALSSYIKRCWETEGAKRPSFETLQRDLDDALRSLKKDFYAAPKLKVNREKNYDIFISFSNKDMETVATSLIGMLDMLGYKVFNQKRDFAGVQVSKAQMQEFAKNSTVVLALVSPQYFDSQWCRAEVEAADENGVPIVPVYSSANYSRNSMLDLMQRMDDPEVGKAVKACFKRGKNLIDVHNVEHVSSVNKSIKEDILLIFFPEGRTNHAQ